MKEEIWTKEELAEYLKITPRMVDKLRKQGMPCFKLGKLVRFNKEDILEWIYKNKDQK